MGCSTVSQSYLTRAEVRLAVLSFFLGEGAYSDVVSEAHEAVELGLRAMLMQQGVKPHVEDNLRRLVVEHRAKLPKDVGAKAEQLAEISRWLRKERDFAFYGDVDFIPSAEYTREDAERALRDARTVIDAARKTIAAGSG